MRFNVPRSCCQGARELLELAAVDGGTRGGDTAACARIGLLARTLALDGDRIDPVAKAKRPRMSGASPGVYAERLAQVRASAASVLARSRAICPASSVAVSAAVVAAVASAMAEAMPPVTDTNWRRTNVWPADSFKKKPQQKLTLQIAKTRWTKHATIRVHQARPGSTTLCSATPWRCPRRASGDRYCQSRGGEFARVRASRTQVGTAKAGREHEEEHKASQVRAGMSARRKRRCQPAPPSPISRQTLAPATWDRTADSAWCRVSAARTGSRQDFFPRVMHACIND